MIEGGATLRGADMIYRAVLLPLSERTVTIEHVLGAILSLAVCRRGALDAGQLPSFTEAAGREKPFTVAGLFFVTVL
jgi:hypothetical protein